jgi:hypothetical protein
MEDILDLLSDTTMIRTPRLLKTLFLAGCSKTFRCKLSFAKSRFVVDPACGAGRERPKSLGVRRTKKYVGMTRDEGIAA